MCSWLSAALTSWISVRCPAALTASLGSGSSEHLCISVVSHACERTEPRCKSHQQLRSWTTSLGTSFRSDELLLRVVSGGPIACVTVRCADQRIGTVKIISETSSGWRSCLSAHIKLKCTPCQVQHLQDSAHIMPGLPKDYVPSASTMLWSTSATEGAPSTRKRRDPQRSAEGDIR